MLQPDTISANDYLLEAFRLMRFSKQPHLTVLEGGQVIGAIHIQDLEQLPEPVLMNGDVRDYCRKESLCKR